MDSPVAHSPDKKGEEADGNAGSIPAASTPDEVGPLRADQTEWIEERRPATQLRPTPEHYIYYAHTWLPVKRVVITQHTTTTYPADEGAHYRAETTKVEVTAGGQLLTFSPDNLVLHRRPRRWHTDPRHSPSTRTNQWDWHTRNYLTGAPC